MSTRIRKRTHKNPDKPMSSRARRKALAKRLFVPGLGSQAVLRRKRKARKLFEQFDA